MTVYDSLKEALDDVSGTDGEFQPSLTVELASLDPGKTLTVDSTAADFTLLNAATDTGYASQLITEWGPIRRIGGKPVRFSNELAWENTDEDSAWSTATHILIMDGEFGLIKTAIPISPPLDLPAGESYVRKISIAVRNP